MRLILAILIASALWSRAEVAPNQTVNLAFDYPQPGTVTFFIRATAGAATSVIGVTTNIAFAWTNVTPLAWRLSVTASNIWGESTPSTPLFLPQPPAQPTNLRPITTTFKVTPPVSFERTTDLAQWGERFRLFKPDSNGVMIVMQTIMPSEPFSFYRIRPTPQIGQPPFP